MHIVVYICLIGIIGLLTYLSGYIYALLDKRGHLSHWWFFGDIRAMFAALLTGSELDGERRHGRLVRDAETAQDSQDGLRREFTHIAIVIALIGVLCLIIWLIKRAGGL